MTRLTRLHRLIPMLALATLLAACDSVGTSSNPDLSNTENNYNGPPAKTADVRSFQLNFWDFLKENNRCGQCHASGQEPTFVDLNDVNKAYSKAIKYASLQDPKSSIFVAKVASGHNCWLDSLSTCSVNVEKMISNWATDSNITSARLIQLTAPEPRPPGSAKSFPASATTPGNDGTTTFENSVYQLLAGVGNCQNCHNEDAAGLAQAPFFASATVELAFQAAKSKMDIDNPGNSRFVERLVEQHNCWSSDCANDPVSSDAAEMEQVIEAFADTIDLTPVNSLLKTSMALAMTEGVVAAGGNRHESHLVALWEFKARAQRTAYDTSGIDPAIDLSLIGSVTWLDNYGLEFSGGRALANTEDSVKLNDFIQSTGEYAVEAWIVPNNVVQENANIISYSGADNSRNFTLGQMKYNYDFYNRIDVIPPEPNGEPFLSTGANAEELVQATLQHVVVNYDPLEGRSIYVNGVLVNVNDSAANPSTVNNVWDDTFGFILGNETSGNRPWAGQIRMVAIHSRTLTQAQILQNLEVGVGEKYFLMFYIGHRIGVPEAYILFEVAQYDNYSYLFNMPTFVNLDAGWTPTPINIRGMRIGINGKEAVTGQAFANIDVTIDDRYDPEFGQQLSSVGTIIALEKGPNSDEFFLTFENIGTQSFNYVDIDPTVPDDPLTPVAPIASDIGIRSFEEINASISAITGISVDNPAVEDVYEDYVQQLPAIEAIDAFLPSHQMAITQLALTSCSELVDREVDLLTNTGFFGSFDFSQSAEAAFGQVRADSTDPIDTIMTQAQIDNRNLIADALLTAAMNVDQVDDTKNLTSQPAELEMVGLLAGDFVLIPGDPGDPAATPPVPPTADEVHETPQTLDTGANLENYNSLFMTLLNTCTPVVIDPNLPPPSCAPEDTVERTAQIVKGVCAAATGAAAMLVQ